MQKVTEKWFEWMHPQKWRVSLGLALSLILIPQVALGIFPLQCLSFIDENFIATVWQVLASIIGISFVIVVFLTEYSQDQIYERRAFPIYVSATSMIFIVMIGLLTLISMGINLIILKSPAKNLNWVNGISLWNTILFLINLILTINLYIRTYQLLSPSYFRKILVSYHRKKVLDRVYQELFKRVKQKLAIDYMEQLEIDASIFRSNHHNTKISVTIPKTVSEPQVIDDVNFGMLKIATRNARKIVSNFNKDLITFWGVPGNNISNEKAEIALISHELNQKRVTDFLSHSIKTAPWISKRLESASEDLLINRDLISIAIASGQAENVESSLNLYIETIEAFLDSLKQLGYRFTPDLVDTEDGWFNRWDIFDTVLQQYVGLLRDAFKSNNIGIINEFVSFPRRVMEKAFQYQDHLAFRRFVNLYPLIYSLTIQHITDKQTIDQIKERCGLLVAEFANYRIEPKFSEDYIGEKEAEELTAYAEEILAMFSQLAKYQIDNRDFVHYRLTIGSMRRLLNEPFTNYGDFKIDHLGFQIKFAEDEKIKEKLTKQLQDMTKLNRKLTDLRNLQRAALFGLGTWVCHLLDKENITGDDFGKFSQPINQEFNNFKILSEGYIRAISMDDRHRFNWSSWEMDEWQDEAYGEGKFGSMHFSSWLSFYFTYRALELTPENPESTIDIEPTSNTKGILDSTKGNIEHFKGNEAWRPIVNGLGNFNLRSEILEKSIAIAHSKQLVFEEIDLVQSPINDDKVNDFLNDVEKTWQETGKMRRLFIEYNRYIPKPNVAPPKEIAPFGFYHRVPKGAFVDQPRISYVGFGESYGRGMAQGEDKIICAAFNKLPTVQASLSNFNDAILRELLVLQAKGLNPIILHGHELHRQFNETKYFEPYWRSQKSTPNNLKNISGFFKDTAVISTTIGSKIVVIFEPAIFGDLVQYKVDENKSDFPLSFTLTEISEERAKKYIVDHPEFTKHPESGVELLEDDALRKVRQNIELALWQKFDIENIDQEAGVVINFDNNETASETKQE